MISLFKQMQTILFPGLDDDESVYNVGAASSAASVTADDHIWPSMQDLNTRLRRVITSYQRNYKKEELKQQQKAKVRFIKPDYCYCCCINEVMDLLVYVCA